MCVDCITDVSENLPPEYGAWESEGIFRVDKKSGKKKDLQR